MYMGRISNGDRAICQYKHRETRRHINVDTAGQTWTVVYNDMTDAITIRQVTMDAARAFVLSGGKE